MTGKPKEIFGTKTPSMTSRCNQSASLRLIISMSADRFAKSADNKEGEIKVLTCLDFVSGKTLFNNQLLIELTLIKTTDAIFITDFSSLVSSRNMSNEMQSHLRRVCIK